LLSWALLNEVPPMLAIVGGALSLVGVAIATRRVGLRRSPSSLRADRAL
jgi:drug/metabolite transporter (DMT)-like permease